MSEQKPTYGSMSTRNDDIEMKQDSEGISPSEVFQLYKEVPQFSSTIGHGLYQQLEDFESYRVRNLCLFHLGCYIVSAAVFFPFIEGWTAIDSIYFSVIVFTTVGYGDIVPATDAGKLFTVCLSIYGITIIGIALGIGGEYFLQIQTEKLNEIRSKAKEEVMDMFMTSDSDDEDDVEEKQKRKKEDRNEPNLEDVPPLIEDIKQVAWRETPVVLGMLVFAIFMSILHFEGNLSVVSSVYYTVISGTSVGFGDIAPHSQSTRVGCIFLLPLLVAVMGEFCGHVASVYQRRQNQKSEVKFIKNALTITDLHNMDLTHNGRVSEHEFLVYMLMALHKIQEEDIQSIQSLFKELDKNGTGYLDSRDLLRRKKNSKHSSGNSSSQEPQSSV